MANRLDSALSAEVGAATQQAQGSLTYLVHEADQRRRALHRAFDDTLQRFDEMQRTALHQHMQSVSEVLGKVGGSDKATECARGLQKYSEPEVALGSIQAPSPAICEGSTRDGTFTFRHDLAGRQVSTIVDHGSHASIIQEVREAVRDEMKTALSVSHGNGARTPRSPSVRSHAPGAPRAQERAGVLDAAGRELRAPANMEFKAPEEDEHLNSPCGDGEEDASKRGDSKEGETSNQYGYPHLASHLNLINSLSSQYSLDYSKTQAERIAEHVTTHRNCILRCGRMYAQLGVARAPDRHDCLSRIADSRWFHIVTQVVILVNAVFMAYVADQEIKRIFDPSLPDPLSFGEPSFFVLYSLEFLVRIARYRLHFFYGQGWLSNWLDFVVLLGQLLSLLLSEMSTNISWLRLIRTVRLLKTARILRLMTMFNTLRTIVESIFSTMLDFIWSTVLICAFLYMVALIFVFRLADFLEHGDHTELTQTQQDELLLAFGSVERAMLNLFMAVNGGNDWSLYFETLEPTGRINQSIFLCYVTFATLALLNIILGVFVDHVMKNMLVSKEEKADEHVMEEEKLKADLMSLCVEADVDGDGRISFEEWKCCVREAKIISYLDLMGFRMHDLMEYFQLCMHHSADSLVEVDGFVRGCMRLRGGASWFDQQAMSFQLMNLTKKLADEHKETRRLIMQNRPRGPTRGLPSSGLR